MGYEASVQGFDLRVTSEEGLMSYLNHTGKRQFPYDDVESAMEDYFSSDFITIDPDGTFEELNIICLNYYVSVWESIAPYLSGYIEWIGEDKQAWRDYFRDGKVESEYPEIIWPSEYFYTEKWCDDDIAKLIRDYDIDDDDPLFQELLAEVKSRASHMFDDASKRNEQLHYLYCSLRT